jgi:hypothetical protein
MELLLILNLLLASFNALVIHSNDKTVGSVPLPLDLIMEAQDKLALAGPIAFDKKLLGEQFGFTETTAYTTTGAIFLMVTGLVLVFYGYGTIKLIMFLSGAYAFAMLSVTVLNYLAARGLINLDSNRDLVYFVTMIVAGIIGGFISLCLYKVGIFILGGMSGFLVATLLLQLDPISNALQGEIARYLFFGAFILVFGVLLVVYQATILKFATSFVGSYAFFVGVDHWIQSGFGTFLYNAVYNIKLSSVESTTYVMVAGFLMLFVMGVFVQNRYNGRHGKRKE